MFPLMEKRKECAVEQEVDHNKTPLSGLIHEGIVLLLDHVRFARGLRNAVGESDGGGEEHGEKHGGAVERDAFPGGVTNGSNEATIRKDRVVQIAIRI
ncbi:hypothetical protein C1H46_000051 [Malus baccata]|uniref:Uncharacterized protein n=1 Tax=Malus baccata TaxID=106549 RepID=A0A540NSW4_MALBA|nr:hypothetical protein C1H46_000051 [Malus baccata]